MWEEDRGSKITEFDHLLDYLGTGPWTLLHFIVFAVCKSFLGMQSVGGAFVAPLMNYTCSHPPLDNNLDGPTQHPTHHNVTNITITKIDECRFFVNTSEGLGREDRCTQWHFNHSTFGETITSEMSLVCGRSFFVPLYQSVYMLGAAIGTCIGGILSDKVGRRPVFVGSIVTCVVVACVTTFLPNITLILAARVIVGFFYMAATQSGFGLVMETTRGSVRPVAGVIAALPWGLGMMVLSGWGYLVRQWRHLQLITSLPFVLTFPALWLIGESPRWLLVQGDVRRAQVEIDRAARWHRVQPPPHNTLPLIMKNLQRETSVQCKEASRSQIKSVWEWLRCRLLDLVILFRTKELCKLTLVICLNFYVVSMVYYGLSLSAVNYSTDPFVYMCLSGLAEIPSYTLTGPIMAKVGRKAPAIACFMTTGLALIVIPFLPKSSMWARVCLALLGKVSSTSVFMQLYVYASEVFPTEVRCQGLGTGILFSRFGSILSPFVNDILVPIYPWMTSVLFGGLSVVAGIATCLLPETKDASMPDVIADKHKQAQRTSTATSHAEEEIALENLTRELET